MTKVFGKKDQISAVQARHNAQKIAFAPFIYQATRALRDLGILDLLMRDQKEGLKVSTIATQLGLSDYGVAVLLEAGLGAEVVYTEHQRYFLTKTGYYILNDELTRVNMNFVGDVCYQSMTNLQEAVVTGKPSGLSRFGAWDTIYQGLTQLPTDVQKSWFEFDHFYSDAAFSAALPIVFALNPKHILDVGGNTGKWSLNCLRYDDRVHMTIVDLPPQLELANKNLTEAGFDGRFSTYGIDMLDDGQRLPYSADVIWMSQFLDCFSTENIVRILTCARGSLNQNTSLFILESFWDKQRFDAAAFTLVNTSLYFACVANGNSKMYHSDELKKYATQAGLSLYQEIDGIGFGHTLLEYRLN